LSQLGIETCGEASMSAAMMGADSVKVRKYKMTPQPNYRLRDETEKLCGYHPVGSLTYDLHETISQSY
jgi:hypothetical protein